MLELLNELCMQNKNVSIYTDSNTSKFIYGRILCVDDQYIAIYMISPDGVYDGIVVKQMDEIIRLEIDTRYAERMEKLCSMFELPPFDYVIREGKIKESLLSVALETKQIISIELSNSGSDDVVGFVEELVNNQCRIKQINSYGLEDGVSYVKIDHISQISYGSEDEIRIFNLWKLTDK